VQKTETPTSTGPVFRPVIFEAPYVSGGAGIPSPLEGGLFGARIKGRGTGRKKAYVSSLSANVLGLGAVRRAPSGPFMGLEHRQRVTGPQPVLQRKKTKYKQQTVKLKKREKILGPLDYLGRKR
jgi:hypothetical protein